MVPYLRRNVEGSPRHIQWPDYQGMLFSLKPSWRKVQELGLRQSYLNDEGTHKFSKKVRKFQTG